MRRISSRWTFFYKRIFPIIWFGFLAVFIVVSLFTTTHADTTAIFPFVMIPLIMMGFGFYIMRKLVFDLVDEVWDDGDALVVKNSGQEQRIALADIKNVNYSPWVNPPRVTLSLRRPSVFGDRVTFCAPVRIMPLTANPRINDLIERVDQARLRHAS
jgi:hypothetical protein